MEAAQSYSAQRTWYRKVKIDDLEIFYREGGIPGKPTILLLHGFPSSSHMFRNLIESLSGEFHLIAPDYPGFGYSSAPTPADFDYSFDHLAEIMERFIDVLDLRNISFYMQDYGGPIGFRIIKKRPELVRCLLIQNANVFMEGLGPDVQKIGALTQANNFKALEAVVDYMMSMDGIKEEYTYGSVHLDAISPDSYYMDHLFFSQPGRKQIQKILFQNYGSNFPKYPEWQEYLRAYQPPILITWGKNDKIFPGSGALAYQSVLPDAEIHLFDGGHFLLEEYGKEVAELIHAFLNKSGNIDNNVSLVS